MMTSLFIKAVYGFWTSLMLLFVRAIKRSFDAFFSSGFFFLSLFSFCCFCVFCVLLFDNDEGHNQLWSPPCEDSHHVHPLRQARVPQPEEALRVVRLPRHPHAPLQLGDQGAPPSHRRHRPLPPPPRGPAPLPQRLPFGFVTVLFLSFLFISTASRTHRAIENSEAVLKETKTAFWTMCFSRVYFCSTHRHAEAEAGCAEDRGVEAVSGGRVRAPVGCVAPRTLVHTANRLRGLSLFTKTSPPTPFLDLFRKSKLPFFLQTHPFTHREQTAANMCKRGNERE